jgi:hypothetical protein
MRRAAAFLALCCLWGALPAAGSTPSVLGGWPTNEDDLPHLEAPHEWWYVAVQSPEEGPCGPWQAMVSFVRDAEAGNDALLVTTVVDGVPANHTIEFPRRSMGYGFFGPVPEMPSYVVFLGDNYFSVDRFTGERYVEASSGNTRLVLFLDAATPSLWHRRTIEGAGLLDVTMAPRANVSGRLEVNGVQCPASGLGFYEHVWGTWSRVPMWGVDFLSAHAADWSVVARRTPMRGESRGLPTNALAEPVMIVTDGTHIFEADTATFAMTESGTHPELGVPIPTGYEVTGTGFGLTGPASVSLAIGSPVLATILLPLSSGILEGWAPATVTVDGVSNAGTSEAELQRFGTTYPH